MKPELPVTWAPPEHLKEMRRRFYWPGLERDVRNWCRWCLTCAKRKPPHGKKKGYLKQTFANAPMERVAIDIVGPLPRTANGNEYILVVCDYFTKRVECYALPDHQAQTVADTVVLCGKQFCFSVWGTLRNPFGPGSRV